MSAFNEIEGHLKRTLHGNRDGAPGFAKLLNEYALKHARHVRPPDVDLLRHLADLRNTLTHGQRLNNQPLAEPTEATVEAIQRLRDALKRPETALAALKQTKPFIAAPTGTVRATLHTMYTNDYSQVPVYEGERYLGLLTTNTVARWLADQMNQHDGLAEDVAVGEVLEFSEGIERVVHLPRDVSTVEAIWHFTNAAESGHPMTALIITHSGKTTESPLAIVVAQDLAVFDLTRHEPREVPQRYGEGRVGSDTDA
jgi:predicted transcriptional regulator